MRTELQTLEEALFAERRLIASTSLHYLYLQLLLVTFKIYHLLCIPKRWRILR